MKTRSARISLRTGGQEICGQGEPRGWTGSLPRSTASGGRGTVSFLPVPKFLPRSFFRSKANELVWGSAMDSGIFYPMTIDERFSDLRAVLEDQTRHSQRMASLYYVASLALMLLALVSTIAASAPGIFHLVRTPETVGYIAGLPAVFGLAAITLKLDEKMAMGIPKGRKNKERPAPPALWGSLSHDCRAYIQH
jgi:hypothetical protein